ncbi:hypothetical protein GGI11_000478 [Coemansia sp. RSA 2049]|nr:hypothetical protein H4217_003383 [Coemansia sp. RSA 1939]KAJ2524901.1 hypothetical protein GGI11_000478 [Coemansia sp. RSA 2049]KAJ2613702.1 hypothetical protein EV177_002416 [Coemansia sp. RSA 1804]KAJ2683553.1 hypothetical protein GGH99_004324 [Coemansia sp. RSA 1285]
MRLLRPTSFTTVVIPLAAVLLALSAGTYGSAIPAHGKAKVKAKSGEHGGPSNERIIGGTESAPGEYPSAVTLQIITSDGVGLCGGTLITSSAIVTAAHCVYDFTQGKVVNAQSIRVGYGSNSRSSQTIVTAQRVDVNPSFDPNETVNDIAIVSIEPVELGQSVNVAPIYSGSLAQGAQLTAVGWGLTVTDGGAGAPNGGLPDRLLDTQIVVGSQANCSKFIPGYTSSNGPQICTENALHPGDDTCQGDSGTGVFILSEGKRFLAGLTSYGANLQGNPTCALDDGFAVYTHVSYYRTFIDSIVGDVLRRRLLHNGDPRRAEEPRGDTYAGTHYSSSRPDDDGDGDYYYNYSDADADDHGSAAGYDDESSEAYEEPEHKHHHKHHKHKHHKHKHHDYYSQVTVTVAAAQSSPYADHAW